MLSIGLTASSIAIMGSVDASKGGAAGSLEATGYELGTCLGITLFGVFASAVFSRAIDLPSDLAQDLAKQASRTIGDAYLVGRELTGDQGAVSIEAAKTAFTQTHSVVLTAASTVIAILAVFMFLALAGYRSALQERH